jgi:hypothetical protein
MKEWRQDLLEAAGSALSKGSLKAAVAVWDVLTR